MFILPYTYLAMYIHKYIHRYIVYGLLKRCSASQKPFFLASINKVHFFYLPLRYYCTSVVFVINDIVWYNDAVLLYSQHFQ